VTTRSRRLLFKNKRSTIKDGAPLEEREINAVYWDIGRRVAQTPKISSSHTVFHADFTIVV
jgi:hypothetical protein